MKSRMNIWHPLSWWFSKIGNDGLVQATASSQVDGRKTGIYHGL